MGVFMKSILLLLSLSICLATAADAKPKKSFNRADFTDAQKAEIYKRALESCRKTHGAQLHNVEVNYQYNRVICWSY
jgi:hypothetical protein